MELDETDPPISRQSGCKSSSSSVINLLPPCKISQATPKQSARPSFRKETRTPAAFTTNEEEQNAMFDQQRLDAAAHRKGRPYPK
jgi:hypothetical protein